MSSIMKFLKTCLLGGLVVLLPLLLFYLLFSELMEIIVALATPIADLFPEDTFDKISDPLVIAILLLMGTSFIFGLALRSHRLARIGSLLEQTTLMRLPLYKAVKQLSKGLVGAESDNAFNSGLLEADDGTTELVYIIEEHSDGKLTILVPWAPAGFAGSVKVVSAGRVTRLSASVGDASRVISQWGVGMSDIMRSNGD
jgi:uncharacterized membrane protein